jgi:hypothetical protein
MVAAITHLPPAEIELNMPLAQGLQYQAIWLEMQGNIVESASASLDTAAQWKRIAGA